MSEIIGIIGAGTMGNGIAQTAASNGFDVVMCDIQSGFCRTRCAEYRQESGQVC